MNPLPILLNPDTQQVVPKEPTAEMLTANRSVTADRDEVIRNAWTKMLSAAPPPAAQQTEEAVGYVLWYPSGREFGEKRPDNVNVKWDALYTRPQPPADSELVGKLKAKAEQLRNLGRQPHDEYFGGQWDASIDFAVWLESLLSEHEGKA